jgi:molybdopterin molybdotransferase
MCDPKQGLNHVAAGRHSVDRAQQVIVAAGRVALQVDRVPLAKATGRILASPSDSPDAAASGTLLAANHVPMLASLGRPTLPVFSRLRVGVLTAGGNWVSPGMRPATGQIYNVAGPVLTSLLDSLGTQAIAAPHAGVSEHSLGSTLDMLLAQCNIVLMAGCMSDGQHETLRRALRARGAELSVCRVRMRPATTILLAHLGPKLVVCLPGGLTATFMAFLLFVSPLIRRMQGRELAFPAVWAATAANDATRGVPKPATAATPSDRDEFVWARKLGGSPATTQVELIHRSMNATHAIGAATGIARLGASLYYYPFAHWLR